MHRVMNFSFTRMLITYTQDGRLINFSITASTPHSVIMTRLFGDTVKSIEWSQRCSWWTSSVSDYPHKFHF